MLCLSAIFSYAQKNYNLKVYDENSVLKYKSDINVKTGFYLKPSLAVSPNFPRGFIGLDLGVNVKYVQFSVNSLMGVTDSEFSVFTGMIGYRFPVNSSFTITPKLGYWTIWDEENKIQWTKGNRFIYALELSKRLNNNIDITITGYDGRSARNNQAKYNTIKILSVGITCYLFQ